MKKCLLFFSIFFSLIGQASAANLLEVYQQALCSDQVFRQAVEQRLVDKQGVPISLSNLLPSASAVLIPSISKTNVSGSAAPITGSNTSKNLNFNLNVTQTVFNYAQFANLWIAENISRQADASLNAAVQDLMLRVAKAYFAVLNDEDNINYTLAAKQAYAKQLDQVTQQYNVGLKTITEVYTARASYESSEADYIAAVNQLADDKENLRVITGILYPSLAKLSENFPFVTPKPSNIETWVCTAQRQNWSIKAALFAAEAARQNIKQQFAGNLPTLQLDGDYSISFSRLISSTPFGGGPTPTPGPGPAPSEFEVNGATHSDSLAAGLTLSVPIVQGGYVVASTRKAQYQYKASVAKLEQTAREAFNSTRQSFNNIISGISKIKADRQAIKSSISSLEGLRVAYQVGTETLVDVLNQQQKVFQAQTQYSADRYAYVNSLLQLKAAAGTLCVEDLRAINSWLTYNQSEAFEEEYSAEETFPEIDNSNLPVSKNSTTQSSNRKVIHTAKKSRDKKSALSS